MPMPLTAKHYKAMQYGSIIMEDSAEDIVTAGTKGYGDDPTAYLISDISEQRPKPTAYTAHFENPLREISPSEQ